MDRDMNTQTEKKTMRQEIVQRCSVIVDGPILLGTNFPNIPKRTRLLERRNTSKARTSKEV